MLVAPVTGSTMGVGAFSGDERAVVEAHLRRLDTPALAALVADLWVARGFDTELDGTVLRATRHGETQVVAIGAASVRSVESTVDVVVDLSSGTYEGSRVINAAGLTEQLWYAVDRSVARQLCAQHLGDPPAALSPPRWYQLRLMLRRSRSPGGVAVAIVVLAGVAVVVAAGLGMVQTGGTDAGTPTRADTASNPAGPASVQSGDWDTSAINQPLPPGIRPDGISNLTALSSAHSAALEGRSYTLWRDLSGSEIRDREVVGVRRDIDTTVEGDQYRIETDEIAAGNRTQLGVLYHDGQNSYVAPTNESGAEFRQLGSLEQREFYTRPPARLTESLVETRLSTPTTDLTGTTERDGQELYRLTGRGQPDWPAIGNVEGYNVTALVTLEGFVREVTVSYTVRSGTRLVDVRRDIQYDRVGETTVTPPAWYQTTGDRTDVGG
jgi:hypothetical protein